MKAFIFPGQGSQYTGMGKNLFDNFSVARQRFEQANDILGYNLAEIMFTGTAEELKQTKVTQPAIFLHSVILAELLNDLKPDAVAGHSLGEISALVANGALSFEEGLKLVYKRAQAMQHACEQTHSTMAAVLGLPDATIEEVCAATPGTVVAANYNCPGQLVISGEIKAVELACEALKAAGAKRALVLPVGGAFHSPLMQIAENELASAVKNSHFSTPKAPIYQNATAQRETDPAEIKTQLITQLTAPVKWTQSIQNMVNDGVTEFVEVGPGKTLIGLVKKISPNSITGTAEDILFN